jgi:uracil-DNA glycosylase
MDRFSRLSINNYNYQSWNDYFPHGKIDLLQLTQSVHWNMLFSGSLKSEIKKINQQLNNIVFPDDEKSDNTLVIYPPPQLVFSALDQLIPERISCVFIGQDPYHLDYYNRKTKQLIPLAMGTSFSVPVGISIPSSLGNIYKNAIEFGHMSSYPKHGELSFWVAQGCCLLNTALTVEKKQAGSHSVIWHDFSKKLFSHISDEIAPAVFVLWGKDAIIMSKNISTEKHRTVASSHPSGLSFARGLKSPLDSTVYLPAFRDQDHFGKINELLIEFDREPIIWQI